MGGLSFGKSDLSLNKQPATRRTSSMAPPPIYRILMAIWGLGVTANALSLHWATGIPVASSWIPESDWSTLFHCEQHRFYGMCFRYFVAKL